ncbi:MAG TPA: potassium channel family protein [Humibacter sp.]|nr:potassium channel family protein [Humibacter sp.]
MNQADPVPAVGRRPLTLDRWQRLTDTPLIVVALVFVVAYAWTVLADLRPPADRVQDAVMWGAWALFGIDYIVRLTLAERRWQWFWRHLLDLAIVVLPVLRPLRLLRLVGLLAIFQRFAGTAFRGRAMLYVFSYGAVLVLMAGLAVLDAEQNDIHSRIHSFGEALWWACVTITTVGYGDIVPVTVIGKFIAVGLMIAGVGIVGTVAATIASYFIEKVGERDELEQRVTRRHIKEVMDELAEVKTMLVMMQAGTGPANKVEE